MDIFLLRHFESEKNISNAFSTSSDIEALTETGINGCREFANKFKTLCVDFSIHLDQIHCTDSVRAIQTSKIIAEQFNMPFTSYKDFRSTNAGTLAGKSLIDVQKLDSFFSHNYYLYRKGLLDLYYFDDNWDNPQKETKKSFEERVIKQFLKIIGLNKTFLLVGHRSSITAILLFIARSIGIYPNGFYGHISLDLGKISWMQYDGYTWKIKFINEDIKDIWK